MIQYQDKTVTAKTFAKHKISDRLMEVFDNPQLHLGPEFQNFTMKEQEEILRHVSLFEDRVHRTLGVKFKEIISASNFTKVV
jgi:hypothetical protein